MITESENEYQKRKNENAAADFYFTKPKFISIIHVPLEDQHILFLIQDVPINREARSSIIFSFHYLVQVVTILETCLCYF